MRFIAPAIRVSDSQLQDAPPYLPVVFEGEHVVDARFDGEAYVFNLSRGTIEQALLKGELAPRVQFSDEPAEPGRTKRTFTCVDLVSLKKPATGVNTD